MKMYRCSLFACPCPFRRTFLHCEAKMVRELLEILITMTKTPQESEFPKCPYGFTCEIMNEMSSKNSSKKKTKKCSHHQECSSLVNILSSSPDAINNYFTELNAAIKKDIQQWEESFFQSLFDENFDENLEVNEKEKQEILNKVFFEITKQVFFRKEVWKHETAVSFLKKHGNHQPFDSLGINEQIANIKDSLKQLKSNLTNLKWGYIAPEGANVSYNRGESSKNYILKSKDAQFESPKTPGKRVKTLHLCKDIFAANYEVIQANVGIDRRDHLLKIRAKLMEAATALQEAAEIADVNFKFNDKSKYSYGFEIRDFEVSEIERYLRKSRKKSPLE